MANTRLQECPARGGGQKNDGLRSLVARAARQVISRGLRTQSSHIGTPVTVYFCVKSVVVGELVASDRSIPVYA